MTIRRFCIYTMIFVILISTTTPLAEAAPQHEELTTETDGAVTDLIQAAGVLPTSLFDPDETAWSSRRDMSSAAFADWFDTMKDKYMLIDIEVDEVNGKQEVAGVWQKNVDGRGWAELRNLSSDEFHDKWVSYKEQGYRLVDQEAYTLNGVRKYAGIWVENRENLGWASWRNLTSQEFSDKFAEYKDDYIMVDVEAYSTSDGLRYAMIWVRNSENLGWIERRNLTSEQFSTEFEQNRKEYRVWDIESYKSGSTNYYAVIWVKNKNSRGWAEYRDMSEKSWRNRWYRMRDLGYRLVDFEKYPHGSGYRYAGVWRQNNDRRDWELKDQVNELVQSHLDENNVPGIGVAIAQGGEIKYSRGFGFQDVDDGTWYSGRTLNRLASVSKAVGGVLTMEMLEDGTLTNLDAATTSLVPTMPAHHTHTLRQLLANRGGIGHYDSYNVTIQQYNSALAAAQNFWSTDSDPNTPGTQLVYTPGTACKYSTHGLTILGAALEGAAGKSISTLIEDELSVPFGLSTLQVEDRDDGDANRTTLYDKNNNEVSADNISWKVLGGGLEASAYDLARFGMKMINGTILDDTSLTTLQTVPAPTTCTDPAHSNHSNYALGWRTGTEDGTPVMWKGGNQRGANTTIRVYPEKEIVIVVLANRNEGHSTGTLAQEIGALLLENCPDEVSDSAGYDFSGLSHAILGKAEAIRTEDGLRVSNIGASGDDGIEAKLSRGTALWKANVDLDVGKSIRGSGWITTMWLTARSGRQPLSGMVLQTSELGIAFEATAPDAKYDMQYILDGKLMGSNAGNSNPAAINWDEIWCLLKLPQGVPSEICDIWISYQQNGQGQHEWNLYLPRAVSLVDEDGKTIKANHLRLVEAQSALAAAAERATVDAVEIRVANLDSLTVRSEQSSTQPEETAPAPPEPGPDTELPRKVYMPFVQR